MVKEKQNYLNAHINIYAILIPKWFKDFIPRKERKFMPTKENSRPIWVKCLHHLVSFSFSNFAVGISIEKTSNNIIQK